VANLINLILIVEVTYALFANECDSHCAVENKSNMFVNAIINHNGFNQFEIPTQTLLSVRQMTLTLLVFPIKLQE
jgi:hypothetical protein